MKSFDNLGDSPAGVPVSADDVLEFHAARLLLLFRHCGTANRIDGLTKMAKLDFFVRYPQFFDTVCKRLGVQTVSATKSVESSMIRFHYGPWDDRYYHVLAYLEAKGLLTVAKKKNAFTLTLTEDGKKQAIALSKAAPFGPLVEQMKLVKTTLGTKAGSTLKNLIYETFEKEVGKRSFKEAIQ